MKKSIASSKMKSNKAKFKLKSNNIIIGVVVIVIIIALFFLFKSGDIKNLGGAGRNEFTITNIHQNINNDFPNKEIPVYDEIYCKKKFVQQYNKESGFCSISSVKTLARLNPIVKEVTCSCN